MSAIYLYKIPIQINRDPITTNDSFKFLRTYVSNNLRWKTNTETNHCKSSTTILLPLKNYRIKHQLLFLFC